MIQWISDVKKNEIQWRHYVMTYDVISSFEFRYRLISNVIYAMKERSYFKSDDLPKMQKRSNFQKIQLFLS